MYHGLLAILAAKGYESRNHECTLTAVEHLIGAKETELTLEELYFIRNAGQNTDLDAKSLRETFQYGTRVTVEKELLDRLLGKAKR